LDEGPSVGFAQGEGFAESWVMGAVLVEVGPERTLVVIGAKVTSAP